MSIFDLDRFGPYKNKGEIGFTDFANDPSLVTYPNKEGSICIVNPFPFVLESPQSVMVDEVARGSFKITNTSVRKVQLQVWIYASEPEDSFWLSMRNLPSGQSNDMTQKECPKLDDLSNRTLYPQESLTFWLCCWPKEIGVHSCIVYIVVDGRPIGRLVLILADDKYSKVLVPVSSYPRTRGKDHCTINSFFGGIKPNKLTEFNQFENNRPNYKISYHVQKATRNHQIPKAVREGLSAENYVFYFKDLLNMEELHLEEEMQVYNLEGVSMRRLEESFFTLEVPGLAERRPSLMFGDFIFAKPVSPPHATTYQGKIQQIMADEICLEFAESVPETDVVYNIWFEHDKGKFEKLYHAIETINNNELKQSFLFPSSRRKIIPRSFKAISQLDEEQTKAVELILGCSGGAPYVIFGLPGSGKTRTLAESILQIYQSKPEARLLVCAPSDSAADHILQSILGVDKVATWVRDGDIFRLNAIGRPREDIPREIEKYCCFDNPFYLCPSEVKLQRCRIVVATYISAFDLCAKNPGCFSHIILDDAGQASEPETMVPIANFLDKNTVIILAGDPKQLGPVISSEKAELNGLGKSYLERLCGFDLYNERDQNFVTMLVKNYRSHPEILNQPSSMFYNSELVPAKEVGSLPWTNLLMKVEFPILFFGVYGLDEREGSSPSWFNRIEASKVVQVIMELMEKGVQQLEIGVITEYGQQVASIKKILRGYGLDNIKVGNVEQFQGQEREVIILSLVRSTFKYKSFDKRFRLGFLDNPRRLNVAVTRAKSLLVVIANPYIIDKDQHWGKLLRLCEDKESYKGPELPEQQQEMCVMEKQLRAGEHDSYNAVFVVDCSFWVHSYSIARQHVICYICVCCRLALSWKATVVKLTRHYDHSEIYGTMFIGSRSGS